MEAAETLSEWEKEVAQLRSQYEQLLFFTIPKLLHLYHMITAPELNLDGITQEVSFLFQNEPDVRQKLKNAVKVRIHDVCVLPVYGINSTCERQE